MLSVLIVEDNRIYLNALGQILSHYFECFLAHNMSTARKLMNQFSYDAILLDTGLPDALREKVVSEVKCYAPHSALIVLSGDSEPAHIRQGILDSASEWLVKGRDDQNVEALASRIRTAISHRRQIGMMDTAIAEAKV